MDAKTTFSLQKMKISFKSNKSCIKILLEIK